MSECLPCPFCGSELTYISEDRHHPSSEEMHRFIIECGFCTCSVRGPVDRSQTVAANGAMALWNRRATNA